MIEETTTTTEERPCFVAHEDAGGPCGEPATTTAYGLSFCMRHGEEIKLGAALEEQHVVDEFLVGFGAVPAPVARVISRLGDEERASDGDYWAALVRAYPDVPEDVYERVVRWEEDEQPGYAAVVDNLLDQLHVTHKVIRVAYEARATWLVENLERERESHAAQAAVALERAETRAARN